MEPNPKYYLHKVCDNAFSVPAQAVLNGTLVQAWDVVSIAAYQAEVLAVSLNILEKNDVKFLEAVSEETARLTLLGLKPVVFEARISYFKIAYILRSHEDTKPDKTVLKI